MKAFAALLDALAYEPSRRRKSAHLAAYFRSAPDPDRGIALAALTGTLRYPAAKPALLRERIGTRVDPELFALSYDFVGDLSETIALLWPGSMADGASDLASIDRLLADPDRSRLGERLDAALDRLDATGRWALLKLVTGGLRVGVSAALARQALADAFACDATAIEDIWHALDPPYAPLFAWLEGRAPRPDPAGKPVFRSPMLAHPLEQVELDRLDPADFAAEWKWDGIRVQAVGHPDPAERRLFSRSGEEIGTSFPDLLAALDRPRVLDGELMVVTGGEPAPFARLQTRLNRRKPGARLLAEAPAHLMVYDLLFEGETDCRAEPFAARRARLEAIFAAGPLPRLSLSPRLRFVDWADLARQRGESSANPAIEGVMLKMHQSPYVSGRPKGLWFKWKRDPMTADCVLMYAQRGHGKRSSFYSDFTFGIRDGERIVPVGKAYSGFTDAELKRLDTFVRQNTTNRFGPVREIAHGTDRGLVVEVAFEGLQESPRHKAGLAMRFPRIARIRWDKPVGEIDTLDTLRRFLASGS